MRLLRRNLAVALIVLVALAVQGAGFAGATTGPSAILPNSYTVNAKFANMFVGQYMLKSVPSAAKISSAALEMERTSQGYMYGQGQFYGYDASGQQMSWVVSLYYIRQIGKDHLSIDLITALVNGAKIGNLSVTPPKKGVLSGTLTLYGKKYAIAFHQVSTK